MTNTLYPGQPDYTGPGSGWACWVHHEIPIEYCHSFTERIAYILADKPAHEQAVRLAALTCLPLDRMPHAYNQAKTAHDQAKTAYDQARTAYDQARTALDQARTDYDQARTDSAPALHRLMTELVPSHLWHDDTLVFPQKGTP